MLIFTLASAGALSRGKNVAWTQKFEASFYPVTGGDCASSIRELDLEVPFVLVKLTVMYNLPEGADHEEFLRWRTTEHQEDNASMPGVIKTDFYVAADTALGPPKYRYITEAYWADMESLEASFFAPESQAQLQEDMKRLRDPVFLISREVISSENTGE